MIKNYFKIAWRNLVRNKIYSAINIGGLAVGMAVAMLIGLWIYDELSFNTYHKNYDRIAQVMQSQNEKGELRTWKMVTFPYINEIKTNYSENFKHIVASTDAVESILTAGENKLTKKGLYIEKEAPEMFGLKMLKGSWTGLNDPQSILLSESTSKALFGDKDPMAQTVKIDADKDVKVTGVYEDLPQNTEFHSIQYLASWEYFITVNPFMKAKKWDNQALEMFVEIKPETDFAKATAHIKNSTLNAIKGFDDMKEEAANNPQMWLNPMKNWHLYSKFKNGKAESGLVEYVWIVGLIGFFVLLLACINFMNLSTARSEKRVKEVGIRKAIGSRRGQLVRQFMSESFLVVFIAFVLANLIALLSLKGFNNLAAKELTLPLTNGSFWLFSLVFILLTGFLSGSYPALYLSSFQPVKVLKGTFKIGKFASIPRKILVVTQFTVSVCLIICTLIIYRQVLFAKKRPVGYSREGLILLPKLYSYFPKNLDVLRTELKNTGVVEEMAESQSPVTGVLSANKGFNWKGKNLDKDVSFATLTVSPEYAKTVGWQFIEGRNLSTEFASDSSAFVINETAAKLMDMKNPIGETIKWKSKWMTNNIQQSFTVIGEIKDMVMESPYETPKPTVFFLKGEPNFINIKINPIVSTRDALSKIEAVFKKLIPAAPFEYKFADEEYAKKFIDVERISKLTNVFAILAIFISLLGLFGLTSFVAEQRTKEIGIRKVLGASVTNLWQLLSKEFIVLVVISCFIAAPIAYYFMSNWLQKYTYHTEISWWIFAAAGGGALFITLLTVSYQAIKAAVANPVKSLRTE